MKKFIIIGSIVVVLIVGALIFFLVQPTQLEKPNIELINNVVSWESNDNAVKYEICLNGTNEYLDKNILSMELNNKDSFKIRYIGDEKKYLTSEWSDEIIYNIPVEDTYYTVKWVVEGVVIEIDSNVIYGEIPSFDSETPTKVGNEKFSYEFIGWDQEIAPVTKDITFVALFAEKINNYSVNFYDEDGITLLATVTVSYGNKVIYPNSLPVKNADENQTFVFDKWINKDNISIEDEFSSLTKNMNVYASYKSITQVVTVYFISNNNDCGSVSISSISNIEYGTAIIINGNQIIIDNIIVTAEPAISNECYTYSFDSWTTTETVKNDTIIVANFKQTLNKYSVTWLNGDQVLEFDQFVEYGMLPTYNGDIPFKESENEIVYRFIGWTPSVSKVTADIVYQAQFSTESDKHNVLFYDSDGKTVLASVLVNDGESVEYPYEFPTKFEDELYTYLFEKWVVAPNSNVEADLNNIKSDLCLYAKYLSQVKEYVVTFYDYDGTILKTENVQHGLSATEPEEPYREDYEFIGWDKEYTSITSDTNVFAKYLKLYLVTFIDYDHSVLYSQFVKRGETVSEPTDVPNRQKYIFIGWYVSDLSSKYDFSTQIFEDMVIKANYKAVYSVKFVDNSGNILKEEIVERGNDATPPNVSDNEEYKFMGWDKDYKNITSDVIVKTVFVLKQFSVKFLMPNGELIEETKVEYGCSAIEPNYPEYYYYVNSDETIKKVYQFTSWSCDFNNIKEDTVIYAIYDIPYENPVVVIELMKNSSQVNVLICSNENIKIYGIELTIDYSTDIGSTSIGEVEVFGNKFENGELVLNNNEKYINFAWLNHNGIIIENFTTLFRNIDLLTDEGAKLSENIFKISSDSKIIINYDNSSSEDLTTITPIIIYVWK